jgi:hypothetical protein
MSSFLTVSHVFMPGGMVSIQPFWLMNNRPVEEYMCACEYLKLNDSVGSAAS